MTDAHQTAAAALAAIDLSAYQARLEEIDAEQARLDHAIISAEVRIRRKGAEISQVKISGPNGRAAADALIAGDDVATTVPTLQSLEGEKEVLTSGLKELRRRRNTLDMTRESPRAELRKELGVAADAVAADLRERASSLAQELAGVYANASALSQATGNDDASRLRRQLAPTLVKLAGNGFEAGLCRRATLSVPDDVRQVLEAARPAIEFAQGRIATDVAFPLE